MYASISISIIYREKEVEDKLSISGLFSSSWATGSTVQLKLEGSFDNGMSSELQGLQSLRPGCRNTRY